MSFPFMLVVLLITVQSAVPEVSIDSPCDPRLSQNRTLTLQINSRKDPAGDWITTFNASKSDSRTTNFTLDLAQTVYQCDQAVHIKGVIRSNRANDTARATDRLTFHPRCGTNAAISDDGRTAQKIRSDEALNGVLLTHRTLQTNELFEVRLDKKLDKYPYCMGIGVATYNPETFTIPDQMYTLKSGYWHMYHSHVYINSVITFKDYGRNFNDLKVGDRVGVMVNKFGTLHFFVNGVDQGPAASNIPTAVYGVFELWYNAAKATIVDS